MKLWVGAILIGIILVSGCSLLPKKSAELPLDPTSNHGKYSPILEEQFKGWQKPMELRNLADWPDDQRKDFILKGVTDAAAWKFINNGETVEIWARSFSTPDRFKQAENHIISPVVWKEPAGLAYGDVAQVGILHQPSAPDILFLYASQNNTMFYINYANDGAQYRATKLSQDKKVLADLGRKLVGQAKEVGAGF